MTQTLLPLDVRMKQYEQATTSARIFKGQPLLIRLDGRSFHTFTKGLARPFSSDFSLLMIETANALVDHFGAHIAYTQSDEITLAWYLAPDDPASYPFDGKVHKLESLSAAFASAFFNQQLPKFLPQKTESLALFDARAFAVPDLAEAYHCFLWRQQDGMKNAISMAGRAYFTQKQMHQKSTPWILENLDVQHHVDYQKYPAYFRLGTFLRRAKVLTPMDPKTLEKIPAHLRPQTPTMVERSVIKTHSIVLSEHPNPIDFLFYNAPVQS